MEPVYLCVGLCDSARSARVRFSRSFALAGLVQVARQLGELLFEGFLHVGDALPGVGALSCSTQTCSSRSGVRSVGRGPFGPRRPTSSLFLDIRRLDRPVRRDCQASAASPFLAWARDQRLLPWRR